KRHAIYFALALAGADKAAIIPPAFLKTGRTISLPWGRRRKSGGETITERTQRKRNNDENDMQFISPWRWRARIRPR
ncbi:hypothetical protein CP989_25145, partial [Enterobacter hormaechei]